MTVAPPLSAGTVPDPLPTGTGPDPLSAGTGRDRCSPCGTGDGPIGVGPGFGAHGVCPPTRAARFFGPGDADPEALVGVRIAVLGFGNLGASVATLLAEGRHDLVVGNVDDGYRTKALAAGLPVADLAEAVTDAELVYVLLPDEVIPRAFPTVAGRLRPGATVCFASGYCLAYGLVAPPPTVDVALLAPRMLGEAVLPAARSGQGFSSYLAVERDVSGQAWRRLLGLAAAIGTLERGALELGAADEALVDLLVEQTIGPYLGVAMQLAFALGIEAGLPPEALVLEMYGSGEMSRVFATFAEQGFYRSVRGHGAAAAFGGFLRTLELDAQAMRAHFAAILEDIRSGGFAARLQAEEASGYPTLRAIEALTGGGDPLSQAEERVRASLGLA